MSFKVDPRKRRTKRMLCTVHSRVRMDGTDPYVRASLPTSDADVECEFMTWKQERQSCLSRLCVCPFFFFRTSGDRHRAARAISQTQKDHFPLSITFVYCHCGLEKRHIIINLPVVITSSSSFSTPTWLLVKLSMNAPREKTSARPTLWLPRYEKVLVLSRVICHIIIYHLLFIILISFSYHLFITILILPIIKALANAVRTSLGPRGMDKLLQLEDGSVLISNDGATILSKMNVLHPAAKMLVELSQAQDVQAGDGTTTVVVLAGALLDSASVLLRKGLHPAAVAQYFLQAAETACECLKKVARPVVADNRDQLLHAVETCLSSKVVSQNTDLLAPIAVDSVLSLLSSGSRTVDLRDIRLVEQVGGTVDDTELIRGLVLTKGSAKSGGPKRMTQAKIALIQYCLSAPKTDMDNQVVVSDYAAMDRILREERKYILEQCKQIKKTGCNVLLIQKSILRDAYNELSLHFLAKMGILVVTDIERSDVDFICRTLHCQPVAHPDQLDASKLGHAELVEDVYMEGGSNTVVQFTGISNAGSTVTVLLRGSNELVLAEASRSLHDAQCVVRCLVQEPALMAGGGAAESQAAMALRQHARTLSGQDAYCLAAFAEALEVIPYTLAENAGQNAIKIVTELRAQQAKGVVGAGIHVKTAQVEDMFAQNVVQPLMVTTSAIRLATETVAMILKIDDLIVVR